METGTGYDRRRERRQELLLGCSLNSSQGLRRSVSVVDLSSHGFNADVGSQPIGGNTAFSVKLAGLETLGAELCWASEENAGFRFDRPLHPAVVDHVVRTNPPRRSED